MRTSASRRVTVTTAAVLALLGLTTSPAPGADDPVVLAAGDIADCASGGDEATAALLADAPDATVLALGDNAYPSATARTYANCYDPSWGQAKARTRPALGNHDYVNRSAQASFDYFGSNLGGGTTGYYSYDLGAWHVVVLNSNCSFVGGCSASSPQGQWLRSDLAAHPAACTLAYLHHPLFTSTLPTTSVRPLYQALYAAGADVVLAGHLHQYERFAPQNANGEADDRGLREFVVGTGGAENHAFGSTVAPNSVVRDDDTFGVLQLTMRATSYDWEFLPVAGGTFTDSGTADCVTGPPNLLADQGFERDANADGRPDNWTSNARFTRSTAVTAPQGTYVGAHTATDASTTSYTIQQAVRGVTAGRTYAVSGRFDVPPTSDTFTFTYEVAWRDVAGAVIARNTVTSFTATTQGIWQQAGASLVAPSGTASAQVRMVVRGLNATVYVDDLSFRAG